LTAFLYNTFAPAFEYAGSVLNILGEHIQLVIDGFGRMRDSAISAYKTVKNVVSYNPIIGSGSIDGRATGGAVSAGTPYFVGERGAELFVPSSNGTIIPNNALGGGGSAVSVMQGATINVSNQADENRLAKTIANSITQALQNQRNGLASAI